jgi:cytochrome c peroxidase
MRFANDSWKLKAIVVLALATGVGILSYRGIPGETVRADFRGPNPFRGNGNSSQSLKVQLGELLFNETNLSTPAGQSCASCHSQTAGFTYPESNDNLKKGIAEGAISKRFGFRAVPTMAYSSFIAAGPPQYDPSLTAYVGGLFWDGRATDLANQATFPFQNPNEMNDLVHNMGSPALVVQLLQQTPEAKLFTEVFGWDIFSQPTSVVFNDLTVAIAAYEQSDEVSPFTSKYDAYVAGRAQFTDAELDGLRLVTGSWSGRPGGPPYKKMAQCVLCHGIPDDPSQGPDLWTNTCYANVGVPRNPDNPYYTETNSNKDPAGYNPLGYDFVDIGLGDYLYPQMGLPSGNMGPGSNGQGDFLAINGAFKAPTLRNVDRRPRPSFVKAYFHNGVFKDLKTVVHFYNTRNLTTKPGEVIDFTQDNPYANLEGTPLFAEPEFPSPVTLQNPQGAPGSSSAQVGNLGLTDKEEDHIVAFLKTLSDGYEPGHP